MLSIGVDCSVFVLMKGGSNAEPPLGTADLTCQLDRGPLSDQ